MKMQQALFFFLLNRAHLSSLLSPPSCSSAAGFFLSSRSIQQCASMTLSLSRIFLFEEKQIATFNFLLDLCVIHS